MKIEVFGSSSKGNGYLIDDTLVIECGISSKEILKAVNYDINKIEAVLITHSHLDHAKHVKEWDKLNIDIFSTQGTFEELGIEKKHNIIHIKYGKVYMLGNYVIYVFETKHDAKEPCGFVIINTDTKEKLLFATDTYYIEENFKNLDYAMIECNFSEKLVENMEDVKTRRLYASHMSLENLKLYFKNSYTNTLKNVMLLHLSENNSDKKLFETEIKEIVKCDVCTAEKGIYNFNKEPF